MAFATDKARTKSLVLYLVFVMISAVMWGIVTFNNTIIMDVEIPVKITSRPANIHFLSQVPDTLTLNVSSRGSAFLKYIFLPTPQLELRFSDYIDGNGSFRVDATHLKKALSKVLSKTTINQVLPGEISARYTDQPGKRVPVMHDVDATAASSCKICGDVSISPDSVLIYGDTKTLKKISEVYTRHVVAHGLTDTLTRRVTIASIDGVLIEPRHIDITIPVDKMVARKINVPITVRNAPSDVSLVLFPSKVGVTYFAPKHYVSKSNIMVAVDYNSININTPGNKVGLIMAECPGAFDDVELELDSVEYIVEKH